MLSEILAPLFGCHQEFLLESQKAILILTVNLGNIRLDSEKCCKT